MIAERYEVERQKRELGTGFTPTDPGAGKWFRPLTWFADPGRFRPHDHVTIPFSVATLERGLNSLVTKGLVTKMRIRRDPITGRRIESGRRNLYTNQFATLAADVALSDAEIAQLLEDDDDDDEDIDAAPV